MMIQTKSGLSAREEDAIALAASASELDRARGHAGELAAALEHNLQVWVAIRTLVSQSDNALPTPIRDNLIRLSGFVADTIWRDGIEITNFRLNTLININLQIAQGLLEVTKH